MKRRVFLATAPLVVSGCFFKDFTTTARPQLDDRPSAATVTTIGEVCPEFDGAQEMVVTNVGLVEGLEGTGGPTPPGEARTAIIDRLKKSKIENPVGIVDSNDYAIVIVTAVVRPGTRRNELVDVEVSLPPGSRVKSLRGGVLTATPLASFASQAEVRAHLADRGLESKTDGNRMLRGHEVAIARGPIQTALSDPEAGDPSKGVKRGFVWKGAKLLEDRAMYLVLKTEHQRYRQAEQVSQRINEVFHAGDQASSKMAIARHKDLVAVVVPPRYRLNRPHYMRVVRAIPLSPPDDKSEYIRELEDQLQAPETALAAAIRLEAAGQPAYGVLRAALKSEYPLVRFAAAEALAYSGQTECAETLREIAGNHPSLQAYALTALAALDDATGMSKLEELLAAKEPETRYGAFRALREVDPTNPSIRGEWVKRSFVVHPVAVPGNSLVHYLREGRAEFVVFGENAKLLPPFSLTAGTNLTVTAREGDTVATVSRFAQDGSDPNHVQCPLAVADVLRRLGEMGASYADAADLLQRAKERKALSCRLAVDALPRAVPIKRLAVAAREDPKMEQEFDLLDEVDAASAPSLFETAAEPTGGRK